MWPDPVQCARREYSDFAMDRARMTRMAFINEMPRSFTRNSDTRIKDINFN